MKYGDKIRVTKGFFEGLVGTIVDKDDFEGVETFTVITIKDDKFPIFYNVKVKDAKIINKENNNAKVKA